jgi:hypothetical protein
VLKSLKLGEDGVTQEVEQPPVISTAAPAMDWYNEGWQEFEDEEGLEGMDRNELELLLQPSANVPIQREGHRLQRVLSRALLAEEDSQYVEHHPNTGKVLSNTRMDVDVSLDSTYGPFQGEIDWRIAEWAILDSPGHNSLDRLLSIPNVSSFLLFLSNPCLMADS